MRIFLIIVLSLSAGFLIGRFSSERKVAVVETVAVREIPVPVEETRVDTVFVPKIIERENVAITEANKGCVERLKYSGSDVLVTSRWFVPSISSWREKTVIVKPPDFWFVETEIGLIGKSPWSQLKFGRTFSHQRFSVFLSGGTLGLGFGVRVRL